MIKKTIRIAFAYMDTHNRGNIETFLNTEFNIIFDYENPEYVFFGVEFLWNDGSGYNEYVYLLRKYEKSITIFYSCESLLPDFNLFDYIICRDNIQFGDRYIRFFYNTNLNDNSDKRKSIDEVRKLLSQKKYFCNFIYSYAGGYYVRDLIFDELSKYKFVHALGNHKRNCNIKIAPRNGEWYNSSVESKAPFKFSIAVENGIYRDGVTEKIYTSFLANTVPIYFGDDNIDFYFNKKAFINYHDYNNINDLIERVKEVDNNDDLWIEMMTEPFRTSEQLAFLKEEMKKSNEMMKNIFRADFEKAKRRPEGTCVNIAKKIVLQSNIDNLSVNEKSLIDKIETLYKENSSLKNKLNNKDKLNKIVNKIAWFIPIAKLRANFRNKYL